MLNYKIGEFYINIDNLIELKRELLNNYRIALYQLHPEIFEVIDFNDDEIFSFPPLTNFISYPDSKEILDSLLIPCLDKTTITLLSDQHGVIELPNIGYWKGETHTYYTFEKLSNKIIKTDVNYKFYPFEYYENIKIVLKIASYKNGPFSDHPICPLQLKDAFNGSQGFVQIIQQGSASSDYRKAFSKYFSSTVVTPNNIYAITIKNESKWIELSANVNKLQTQSEELFLKLREANRTWNTEEIQEKLFLDLVGEAVNLYRVNVPTTWDANTLLEYKNIVMGSDERPKFRDFN